MDRKTVLLPLDERPCNYDYPRLLFRDSLNLTLPPRRLLGDKKRPAAWEGIRDFLADECASADGLILSLDMLLYGGLIPSRLHRLDAGTVTRRLSLLNELKRARPGLRIFGFASIMRCPRYSSADEEPDYYGECGAEIHALGAALHRERLGLTDSGETAAEKAALLSKIPASALSDYTSRRAFNLAFVRESLRLRAEGTLDALVLPQDDSAEFGYTAMDQEAVRQSLAETGLSAEVLLYPGSDEAGVTMCARMANRLAGRSPRVFVKYAATGAAFVVPAYEDRPLGETVKYQLLAAGCRAAWDPASSDFMLAVSAPGGMMLEAVRQSRREPAYAIGRCLPEFVQAIGDAMETGLPVTVADNAYANGGDLELTDMLAGEGLLDGLAGYAGWNTSSNTLGTAIGQGVAFCGGQSRQGRLDFLALRLAEDAGYMSVVRRRVSDKLAGLGLSYFDVGKSRGPAAELVKQGIVEFCRTRLGEFGKRIAVEDVSMPWRRMFEIALKVSYRSGS